MVLMGKIQDKETDNGTKLKTGRIGSKKKQNWGKGFFGVGQIGIRNWIPFLLYIPLFPSDLHIVTYLKRNNQLHI